MPDYFANSFNKYNALENLGATPGKSCPGAQSEEVPIPAPFFVNTSVLPQETRLVFTCKTLNSLESLLGKFSEGYCSLT